MKSGFTIALGLALLIEPRHGLAALRIVHIGEPNLAIPAWIARVLRLPAKATVHGFLLLCKNPFAAA